jgi:hypothetical protein
VHAAIISFLVAIICACKHTASDVFLYSLAIFVLSIGTFLGFSLIGCLDPDRKTVVRSRISIGNTREDLYKDGYTKYELDCFEEDEGVVIPTDSSEKEREYQELIEKERCAYEKTLSHYRDALNDSEGMREKGLAEALAKGRVKGRAEGETIKAKSIAKKLKEMHMPTADISAITGLSVEDVEAI